MIHLSSPPLSDRLATTYWKCIKNT